MQRYNHQHEHSGLKFVTPAQRHDGLGGAIPAALKQVYDAAKKARLRAHDQRNAGLEPEERGVAESRPRPAGGIKKSRLTIYHISVDNYRWATGAGYQVFEIFFLYVLYFNRSMSEHAPYVLPFGFGG